MSELSEARIKEIALEHDVPEELVKLIAEFGIILPGSLRCMWIKFRCLTCIGPLRKLIYCIKAASCIARGY